MAHFILEYSSNISSSELRVDRLFEALHESAVASGMFPLAGVRSRAIAYDDFRVADGNKERCFINLSVKVGAGRALEERQAVGKQLFDVLTKHLEEVYQRRSIAISFEMRELDPDVKFNLNNIHHELTK